MERQTVMSFFSSQHVATTSQAYPFSVCGIHVSAPYKLTARLWVMSTNGGEAGERITEESQHSSPQAVRPCLGRIVHHIQGYYDW